MKKLLGILVTVLFLAGCNGGASGIDVGKVEGDVSRVMGPEDAKVKIVEYSDLECPACGAFHKGAYKEIKANYVDTGLASFELRDFPLPMHSNAFAAAKAAHCAGDQGQYFEFTQMVYEGQPDLEGSTFDSYAEDLGLDVELFEACRKSNKYNKVVNGNIAEGNEMGVRATPTIFINDQKVEGGQAFEVFEQIIEEELAK